MGQVGNLQRVVNPLQRSANPHCVESYGPGVQFDDNAMTNERQQRIRALFDYAITRGPAGAEEFLRSECGEDRELLTEVRALLAEHARSAVTEDPPSGFKPQGGPVFAAGQIVAGRYAVVRYLSRGGMGEVYEAEHLELLKERVALKTLLPAIASDARMIARFKQEIQLSRKITHPNVCRVFDLERHPADGPSWEATYFFTMTFLEGETLSSHLSREGRMTPAEALPVLEQMAEALDAAHQAGVIHRDFKPSNVMLVPSADGMRAVVTDFGLARPAVAAEADTATLSGHVMGTLDYMAPELLTGSQASTGSDIYALGLVAYRMITGTLPFQADNTPVGGAILRAKEQIPSPRRFVPDLEANWERALLRAVDAEPGRRFTRATEFVRELRGERTQMTVSLPPMTRKRVTGAVAAGALLIAALVGWRQWTIVRSRPAPEALAMYQAGVADIQVGAYFAATKALSQAVKVAPKFSLAHARLAEAWLELEMPENAGQEMLLARRQENGGLSEEDRLHIEAVDLTITRDFSAAVTKHERLRVLTGGDSADLDLGRAYEKAGNAAKAMEAYRRAAAGASHSPSASLHLAVMDSQAARAAEAEEAFQNAERQYVLTSNLEGLIEIAQRRGEAADRQMRLADASSFLQRALETARMAGNIQQEIRAELQLATNATLAGDAAKAEGFARAALDTAQVNQMQRLAVRGMLGIGSAFLRRRDFEGAAKYYQDALSLAKAGGSQALIARTLLSLASLHDQTGDSPAAEREALEALSFYRTNDFVKESLQCLALAGRAQRKKGDFARAVASFQQLLEMANKANDKQQIALAHESLASVLQSQERWPESLAEYRKVMEIAADAEHLAWAQVQTGSVLWRLGRYGEAQALFDSAAATAAKYPALELLLASERAEMALSQENFAAATAGARQAMTLKPVPATRIQATLGRALISSGHGREGLQACEEAVSEARKITDRRELLLAQLALLAGRVEMRDQAAARALFEQIVPELESHPESHWRALALMSRLDPGYQSGAAKAAEDLARMWGESAAAGYRQRPDIARLLRSSAKEKK